MKTLKKAMGALLSLLMLFTFAMPAFADDAAGTITISNALKDETYKVYRLLDLESFSGDNYSYKVNADWTGFFADGAAGAEYMTVKAGYVTEWKKDKTTATLQNFAKEALAYANTPNSNGKATVTPVAETTATADGTLKFDNLPFGYYLVGSSVGTLCELNTTTESVTITDKNEKPSVDKVIVGSNDQSSQNNAQIGDTVNFKVTVHAKSGAKNYVVTDTLSKGLTLNNPVTVGNLQAGTDYTLTTETQSDGSTVIEIKFGESYLNGLTADNTDIIITYSATLNKDAVVKGDGNTNSVQLVYGNNSTVETVTKTYTYGLTVKKQNENNELLSGATFTLSKNSNGTDAIKVKADGSRYVVDTTSATETITTPTSGIFTIEGLAAGTYYLTETAAPVGYNKLAEPIEITIDAEGNVRDNTGTLTDDTLVVVNKTGALLPGTGGIGTTIFYIVGGLLMAVAAVLLITKKRMDGDK